MFDKLRRASAASRLIEEQLYEQVVNELANGKRRNGLWAKALANSEGIEDKAKALYIQYRVQSIKDEVEISEAPQERAASPRTRAVSDHETRIAQCEAILTSKGYKLRQRGAGWLVREPLGGRQPVESIEELEQYARSREKR